jgi:hypothetical protein
MDMNTVSYAVAAMTQKIKDPTSPTSAALNATFAPTKASPNYAARVRRTTTTAPGYAPSFQVTDGRLGDASDADILVGSGTTTITTDKYVDQVRVAAGAVLEVARGARIFARSAVVNNGTIRAITTNAANGSGATGGNGGGAPTLGSGSTQLIGAAGGNAGGNGTTTNGATGVASAGKVTQGGLGGAGGIGGASGANTGGASGASGAKTAAMAGVRTVESAHAAWLSAALSTGIAGGSGGGGAGDSTNAGGGGGGGGAAGGFLFIVTNYLTGAGVFTAPGGNGGNGAAGVAGNAAGGAGGGGGGGGIAIIAALDYSEWTGTIVAPGGSLGTGGAGVGTGAAGANGTAGSAGIGLLLNLATVDGKTRADVKAIVSPSVLTTAPLLPTPTVYTYDQAPVRFIGGPKEAKTYGALTYYQSGLQTGNAGWNGPSGGGGFWIMEYVTDAPVHEIRLRNANGKMRLKVDGKFVNDTTVLTYTDGGAQWYQVSFGKSRRFRHFEWQLNQAPFNSIAIGPTDTLYPPRTKRQAPTYILGDSFTEGAIGLTQGATDHFKSWAFQLCDLMGWDHPMIDGEGGTGYVNDSGIDAPAKKVFPQRILDDVAPLPAHLRPKQVVVAGGFNDPTNTQAEKDAFTAAAALTFSRLATQLPGVPVWVVMFVNQGSIGADLIARRDLLKATAMVAPNVVAFIDPIGGSWFPGPLCDVPAPDEPGVAWNTGTGNITAPTGTGNCDFFRSGDTIHPTPAGHEMLASRVAAAITQSLPA